MLLENSAPESPIGGGPIVRVGDRMSTFSPAHRRDRQGRRGHRQGRRRTKDNDPGQIENADRRDPPSSGNATHARRRANPPPGPRLRIDLPLPALGNYHNMADLQAVQDEEADAIANARPGREHIALNDYHNLSACSSPAARLTEVEAPVDTMEKASPSASVLTQATTPDPKRSPRFEE